VTTLITAAKETNFFSISGNFRVKDIGKNGKRESVSSFVYLCRTGKFHFPMQQAGIS